MQKLLLVALGIFCCGCTYTPPGAATTQPAVVKPEHPEVQIEGIDGTQMNGELLNGTVTIESGQGALTLLTDHIYYIIFATDGDTVASKSVKVSGHVRETIFNLQTEHGVFPLQKERLQRIDFPQNPPPAITSAVKPSTTEHNSEQ